MLYKDTEHSVLLYTALGMWKVDHIGQDTNGENDSECQPFVVPLLSHT